MPHCTTDSFLYYNNFHCTILVEQANFNHCCQHSAADGQRQSEIWWHIARVAGNQVGIKFNILARNFVNFPSMWSSLNQSCLLLEYHMQLQFHKHFFQFIAAADEAEEQVVHGWVDSLAGQSWHGGGREEPVHGLHCAHAGNKGRAATSKTLPLCYQAIKLLVKVGREKEGGGT